MTTLLASFWPYVLAALGVAAAFVTRWWTKRQGAQALAQAKVDTAAQTRTDIAAQAQAAVAQAEAAGKATAAQADARAASIAAQGDDAINAELARKGGLRD